MSDSIDRCALLLDKVNDIFTKEYARQITSKYVGEPLASMATISQYDRSKKYIDVLWFANTMRIKGDGVYYLNSLVTHIIDVNTRDKNPVGDYLDLVYILYDDFYQMVELVRIPSNADIREIMANYKKVIDKSSNLMKEINNILDSGDS